jgi:hypothetical protein
MNNKSFLKKFSSFILCAAVVANSLSCAKAEETQEYEFSAPPAPTFNLENSFIGEATKAIGERVFGVQGDASNIEYHVVDLNNRSPENAALRSLFIPGWGQRFNRQRAKGTLFFLTTIGSIVGAVQLYNKSQDTYDEYKVRGERSSSLYDDYEEQQSQALILGGFALVLWGFSVIDAYRNAYRPLYSQNKLQLSMAWTPEETQLKVKKRF